MSGFIEEGFQDLVRKSMTDARPVTIELCRRMFFAGAHHLYWQMQVRIGQSVEITNNDLRVVQAVEEELEEFQRELAMAIITCAPTEGNA